MMKKILLLQLPLLSLLQAPWLHVAVLTLSTGSSRSTSVTVAKQAEQEQRLEHEFVHAGRGGEQYNNDGDDEEEDQEEDAEDYYDECSDKLGAAKCRELANDDSFSGCIRNFERMRDDCVRTCSLCDNVFNVTSEGFYVNNMYSTVPQRIVFGSTAKKEDDEHFVVTADARGRLIQVDMYMFHTVYHDDDEKQSESAEYSYKRHKSSCRNELEDCILHAANGACEEENDVRQYMLQHCRPACFACQKEDDVRAPAGVGSEMRSSSSSGSRESQFQQHQHCPLPDDPLEGLVWQPGSSHHMFRRIVQEDRRSSKILRAAGSPSSSGKIVTIYSQPRSINPIKPIANANEPWIVAIDDFLTTEQCDVLIELGEATPFTSSVSSSRRDAGRHRGGGNDDDDDDSSTDDDAFQTAACVSDQCREHFVMVQVLEKIRQVTGIPMQNYEPLQWRKYNGTTTTTSQGVEEDVDDDVTMLHHDYEPSHFTRFQGPRIMTVFLYLNNVDVSENDDKPGKDVGKLEFPNLDVVSFTQDFKEVKHSISSICCCLCCCCCCCCCRCTIMLLCWLIDGCSEKGTSRYLAKCL
jgi:hypothetical protein